MAYIKNSLFVRNLSPQVSETILREVFGRCDEIEKIIFKPFPSNEKQFFAQIDFRSSAGVAEGSKLSGTAILGVSCICGVIDPVQQAEQTRKMAVESTAQPTEEDLAAQEVEMQADHVRKAKEAAEELRLRTCHIAGLAENTSEDAIRGLCAGFGEVETLRIDKAADGTTFGLVEFKEAKVAHVVKMQRQFLVEDRVLVFTEAKSHVDNAKVEEMTVQFQAPIIDAMNMRSVLAQQGGLADKLAKVKAAASEILGVPKASQQDQSAKQKEKTNKKGKKEKKDKTDKKDKKDKKDKQNKKEKKKQKEKTGEEEGEGKGKNKKKEKRQKKEKTKAKESSPAKRKKPEDEEKEEKEAPCNEEEVMEEEGEEEEMVDIDEEVEVMDGEVIGLAGESSSSSSSSDYGEDALVELPVDVSAGGDDDDVLSDGDDVMCEAPPPKRPLRPPLLVGRGRAVLMRGRGLPLRGRGPMPLPLRGLARSPMASPPPEGAIDLDDNAVLDVEDGPGANRRRRLQGRPPAGVMTV